MGEKLAQQKTVILAAITQILSEKLAQQKADILAAVDEKLEKQRKDIAKDVTDYIHDDLSPLLDEFGSRITRLEEHAQHPPGIPIGITPTSLPGV